MCYACFFVCIYVHVHVCAYLRVWERERGRESEKEIMCVYIYSNKYAHIYVQTYASKKNVQAREEHEMGVCVHVNAEQPVLMY